MKLIFSYYLKLAIDVDVRRLRRILIEAMRYDVRIMTMSIPGGSSANWQSAIGNWQ